jgi:2-polyprenyl-6-methoxyphenol hydroxylase-like FAD-dependent oxidoreductase
VGRLEFITQLTERARSVGVNLRFGTLLKSIDELAEYNLIIAADGVNSLVRRTYEGDFKTSLSYDDNKFVWYGTTKRFDVGAGSSKEEKCDATSARSIATENFVA